MRAGVEQVQAQLFFDSAEEALDHTIKACGGYKEVGARLKPDKAPDLAAQWLRDALNQDKREKLCPSEVLFIAKLGRERGVHAYAQFMSTTLSYAPPVALTTEDVEAARRDMLLKAGAVIAEQMRMLAANGIDFSALAGAAGGSNGAKGAGAR